MTTLQKPKPSIVFMYINQKLKEYITETKPRHELNSLFIVSILIPDQKMLTSVIFWCNITLPTNPIQHSAHLSISRTCMHFSTVFKQAPIKASSYSFFRQETFLVLSQNVQSPPFKFSSKPVTFLCQTMP